MTQNRIVRSVSIPRGAHLHPNAGGGGTNDTQLVELVPPTSREDIFKFSADVVAHIKDLRKRQINEEDKVTLEKLVRELSAKVEAHDRAVQKAQVGATFDRTGYGSLTTFATRLKVPDDLIGVDQSYFNLMTLSPAEAAHVAHLAGRRDMEHAIESSFGVAYLREMQALNDELFFYDLIKKGNGRSHYAVQVMRGENPLQQHPKWNRWAKLTKEFQRALDEATTGEGKEWVPTLLSNRLIDLIQPELRVMSLFEHYPMGSQNVDLPVFKADFVASFVPESLVDASASIPTGEATTGNFSNKVSLVAKKLAEKVLASMEVVEDSVILLSTQLPRLIAKSIGRGLETAGINGDTAVGTGSAQDFDLQSVPTTDARAIFDGLRKKALISNMPNVDLATFSIGNLASIKGAMGTYGVIASQGAWIVGFKGYIKLLTASEGSSIPSAMLTLEKLGPQATILTGMVGVLLGSPVILSEFCREDVASTGKNTMAGPNTLGTLLYVNRESFTVGDRRTIQVRGSAERFIETDQVIYVGTWRGDFKEYYTTVAAANKIVGIGRNFS